MAGIISTTLTSSYNLQAQYTQILSTGAVEIGSGTAVVGTYVSSSFGWTVVNGGTIQVTSSGTGIFLDGRGDRVTNAATGAISATTGVSLADVGTVVNYGTILSSDESVWLNKGGELVNGSTLDTTALLSNGVLLLGDGTVTNDGTISDGSFAGVFISGGGITNGASNDTTALIRSGNTGIETPGSLSLTNYGTISGLSAVAIDDAGSITNAGTMISTENGVRIIGTGTVANSGIILGTTYGLAIHGAATISNTGSIIGTATNADGITLSAGGSVTNGSPTNASASIIGGYDGVRIYGGPGTVINYGSISGATLSGVLIDAAGLVINGSATDTQAAISSNQVGVALNGGGTLQNFGTITGSNFGGVFSGAALTLINGAPTVTSALIASDNVGAELNGISTITNYGSIISHGSYGIETAGLVTNSGTIAGLSAAIIRAGGTLVNSGLVDGLGTGASNVAVYLVGGATLLNAGTISAASGVAVTFDGSGNGLLIVDPGASFGGGLVEANATSSNTLELASGAGIGTLTGLGSQYVNFQNVTVDSGAYWTLAGTNTLAAGTTLLSSGTFVVDGTLTNAGSIGSDVTLGVDAVLTNAASGIINVGSGYAVYAGASSPATVVNYGSIYAGSVRAIVFYDGGSITNLHGATISAAVGITAGGARTDVYNAGAIYGAGAGVGAFLGAGGSVTNIAGGTIGGPCSYGVWIQGGAATVINGGVISGGADAVKLSGNYNDLLVVDPGASFVGRVNGENPIGSPGVSTLELASSSTTGTLSGIGYNYANFSQITFDVGAHWDLTGANTLDAGGTLSNAGSLTLSGATFTDNGVLLNNATIQLDPSTLSVAALYGTGTIDIGASGALYALGTVAAGQSVHFDGASGVAQIATVSAFAGTIDSFVNGDTLDLTGLTYTTGATGIVSGSELIVTSGAQTADIAVSNIANGTHFTVQQDTGTGTELLLCFLAGTGIATPSGEVSVQDLAVGDKVVTASGKVRPITWIGTGRAPTTPGRRDAATPVIVLKSALADNVPNRDLHLTKGHSLFIDGVLIPIEFLINHRSIIWDDTAREVRFYHIELATHDVLLANGVTAESYRDDGNRWLFENANPAWLREAPPPCAPLLTGGSKVDDIWQHLLQRAGPRPGVPLTDEPDLHLLADGQRIDDVLRGDGVHEFRLPRPPGSMRIVSRAGVPQELGLARDARLLGVALRRIVLWSGRRLRVIDTNDAVLAEGFHGFEDAHGFRWTNGDALLPASLFADLSGACAIEITVACTTRYPLIAAEPRRRAA